MSKNNKGFTIIELVISIFILSIAIVGIFTALWIVTILTSDSVDRLTSTYLVQEGMEIVRNIRDNNWLNIRNCQEDEECEYTWVDGLGFDTPYQTDYKNATMQGYTGQYLNDDANGFISYQSCAAGRTSCATKFKRKIIISPVTDSDGDSNHIIKVVVQVSWKTKATILGPGADAFASVTCPGSNCVMAEETLYDWY